MSFAQTTTSASAPAPALQACDDWLATVGVLVPRLRTDKAKTDYTDAPLAKSYAENFKAAEISLQRAGGSTLFAKARGPYDQARAAQAVAEAALDFKAADVARKQASDLAVDIARTYKNVFDAHRMAPLVKRCEEHIAKDTKGRIPADRRKNFQDLAGLFNKAQTTGDYSNWDSDMIAWVESHASAILRDYPNQTADDWFSDGMKKPSGIQKAWGRLRGGPKGSQQAALKGLSEVQKFTAIDGAVDYNKGSLENFVKARFKDLAEEGLVWDISPVELAAVYIYTDKYYAQMNEYLRDQAEGRASKVRAGTDVLCAAATDGLAKLPPYDPTGFPLFRFEQIYSDYLVTRYSPGTTFTVPEYWSAGAARGANVTGKSDAEIVIWGKPVSAGKNVGPISAIKGEGAKGARLKGQGKGEVLFMPGTKFRTKTCKDLMDTGELARLRGSGGLRYRIEVVEL